MSGDLASSFQTVIIDYFALWNLFSFLFAMGLLLVLSRKKSWLFAGMTAEIVGLLLSYVGFIIRALKKGVAIYGVLQPLSAIIIVLFAGFLFFNGVNRYFSTYSRIEQRFVFFYFNVLVSWLLLYLEAILTIGEEKPEDIVMIHIIGVLVLAIAELAGISIYYAAKAIFFPNFRNSAIVENSMFLLAGFTIGAAAFDYHSNIVIIPERLHQYAFSFPNPFKLYTILALLVIFAPYLLMIYHARHSRSILQQAVQSGRGRIDPVAIPRLKLVEFSMYSYLIGSSAGLAATWLPAFAPQYALPYGINFALSVPFITILILFLYFAFQTPLWLKQRWRQLSKEATVA